MDEHTSSGTRCKNPSCGRLLAQNGGGHCKREYCDDACRQTARRHRLEQAHRDEVDRRWATFTAETRSFLDWLTTRYSFGKDLAYAVELAIHRETDRYSAESSAQFEPAMAALREKQLSRVERLQARIHLLEQEAEKPQPRAILSVEQARERARLHGYLDGSYLESTQRLFVSVFQTGRTEPNEVREAIHQERGAETDRLRQCIAELEQELADTSQGRDQVQERFREYVCMTNERLSELTGELAKRRQEQERAAGQEDQRNSEDYREKLMVAGQRTAKLEKQVDIQRQQIAQYHARFYPSSLAVAAEKLLALGALLNYKPLLTYDELTVEIAAGAQAWQVFARSANYDDMAQAILQAGRLEQRMAEQRGGKRDHQIVALAIDEALLEIGRRLGFPRLDFTRYGDGIPVHIQAGELYWTNFSLRANCVEVKRALEVARKRDNQVKPD